MDLKKEFELNEVSKEIETLFNSVMLAVLDYCEEED